jgi:hypothetical protein
MDARIALSRSSMVLPGSVSPSCAGIAPLYLASCGLQLSIASG